jgi:quercetin dioxygenase-like cupin family protein
VSWFFASSQEVYSASRHIVRRNQRRRLKVPDDGVVQELLSPEAPGSIEIYEVTLEPGGGSGPDAYRHEGEKAGLVIAGTLQLLLGNDTHVLAEGDSFRFPSTLLHRFANPGTDTVRFVWIVTSQKRKRRSSVVSSPS